MMDVREMVGWARIRKWKTESVQMARWKEKRTCAAVILYEGKGDGYKGTTGKEELGGRSCV